MLIDEYVLAGLNIVILVETIFIILEHLGNKDYLISRLFSKHSLAGFADSS